MIIVYNPYVHGPTTIEGQVVGYCLTEDEAIIYCEEHGGTLQPLEYISVDNLNGKDE